MSHISKVHSLLESHTNENLYAHLITEAQQTLELKKNIPVLQTDD
ncbi:hypothetical protein VCHE16_3452 [Vibrio paracholerae HE-16]|nr:hypothetical protein VCF_001764 [Vibrio cholerae BX 330286]EKG84532.1 hypothetical protein VCHE16_3452 [Vibrio paracholerae HE-16]CFW13430.1 hypothetical protein [Vibrio cholerae]CPR25149.1 hypothetical protein [Vibrio cholerae]CPR25150.1 hypothetical protein [Vibrio cholerae]